EARLLARRALIVAVAARGAVVVRGARVAATGALGADPLASHVVAVGRAVRVVVVVALLTEVELTARHGEGHEEGEAEGVELGHGRWSLGGGVRWHNAKHRSCHYGTGIELLGTAWDARAPERDLLGAGRPISDRNARKIADRRI